MGVVVVVVVTVLVLSLIASIVLVKCFNMSGSDLG